MVLNPYLQFDGQCEVAMKFYAEILGGKILMMLTYQETPAASQTPPDWQNKIIHARIDVGGMLLMGSDAPPGRQAKPQGFSVSVLSKTPAEAERVFAALSEGGQVTMPMGETFWALRFGMCVDRFGIPWMVNCERPQ